MSREPFSSQPVPPPAQTNGPVPAPEAWLTYGWADLRAARTLYRAGHYMACAFHCHQTLEKGLKAVWTHHRREEPPRMHNLMLLVAHLKDLHPPETVVNAALEAMPHYVTARMPGVPPDDPAHYTREYVRRLLDLVEEAWQWCLQQSK